MKFRARRVSGKTMYRLSRMKRSRRSRFILSIINHKRRPRR